MLYSVISIVRTAIVVPKAYVVLGLSLGTVLAAACSFDASKLHASGAQPRDAGTEAASSGVDGVVDDVGAGPRDLGGVTDSGKPNDGAGNPDTSRMADVLSRNDVISASGDDARAIEPDSSGVSSDGAGDIGQDQDAPVPDAKDANRTLDSVSTDLGTNPGVDAPADISSAFDGAMAGDTDSGGTGDDASTPDSAEAGEVARDALLAADTGTVDIDSAAADTGPTIDPDLVLWYQFEESSGTIAYDSAQFGGVARNATLASAGFGGSATFTTASQVGTHALALSPAGPMGGGGYAVIPSFNTLAPGALTIAVWVNLTAAGPAQNWERVYDFADSTTAPAWFNLAARSGTAPNGPIFNTSNTGHAEADQQKLAGSAVLTGKAWHHIAVVLAEGTPYTGIMYVDGAVAATNSAMTTHLSDIGATTNNWLGRSQFTNDPYFNGSLDDFRVYKRALSQEEIVALMALR
jgi:hypothetical protein